jgi:hypothetical protein
MKKLIALLMAIIMFSVLPFQSFAQANTVKLARGTTVNIKTQSEITSDTSGDIVAVVEDNVYADDGKTIVIEEGTRVILSASIKQNGALGKAGSITISSATTTAIDGKTIALTANLDATGKSKSGLAWGLGIGLGCLSLFGFLCLLIKGGSAQIPAGTYISGVAVDRNYNISVE